MNSSNHRERISVCIVTFNNERTISDALESLFACTRQRPDVFVCDNHSTDRTLAIVRESFPDVHILESPTNEGFSKGNNRVLQQLTSEYHVVMNPDIVLRDDVLQTLSDYLDENPDICMVMPKLLSPDGTEQFTPKRAPSFKYMLGGHLEKYGGIFKKWRDEYTMKGEDLSKPVEIYFCGGCFMFVRTEIFQKVGGFDERYFLYNEDADLTRKVWQHGRVVYYPNAHVVHLWERAYKKNLKYLKIQIESMLKYFWKWRGQPYGNR
ncbi:MAG: glycosyltransferase family 2 protein [Firmicutes bacterium]|nr:glycosyltransferase family 2 protein [Bacillota bacterium]